MTRSASTGQELEFDPEIEARLRRIREEGRKSHEEELKDQPSSSNNSDTEEEEDTMAQNNANANANANNANAERTMVQYGELDPNQDLLSIVYPQSDQEWELKSGLIHWLPTFHGLETEDPHLHLKQFHGVAANMKPHGMPMEEAKLRLFPFSLKDKAKDWIYYLPPGCIRSWADMTRYFLEEYFLASRTTILRKDICGIRQKPKESLHSYWERFKQLCALCPQHQISENLLIQYFYEGLTTMERKVVDAAANGSLVHMTPRAAREL